MGFINYLNRVCKQTVVYWGAPVRDGFSHKTFAAPVEIMARYEAVEELHRLDTGEEVVSKVRLWVLQDVDEGGYIYLGTLDDLDSNPDDPKEIDGASLIISFRKIPLMGSTDEFIRRVSLQLKTTETI